jgi:hemolysin III
MEAIGIQAFLLLLAGGICYTIGAVLYVVGKKKKYMHSVFHLFVNIATFLHFLAIVIYVIP